MSTVRRILVSLMVLMILGGTIPGGTAEAPSAEPAETIPADTAAPAAETEEPEESEVPSETEEPEETEAPSETEEPTETSFPAAKEYPAVIDRWTNPNACPDFSFSPEEELLEIWFPRIRDRDAAILLYQGECWMIDCSDEQAEERVVPLLKALQIEKIDKLFNTHPHHDHINGLPYVDQACPVQELMICFPEDSTKHMINAAAYAREHGILITHYSDEEVFTMGDGLVRLTVWKKCGAEWGMNDRSAVYMISCGDRNILFLADIEARGQKALLENVPAEELKADLLRYPHHGKDPMQKALFEAIDPELTIVTNTQGEKAIKQTAQFLDYRHKATAYTTRGYLHLMTDGTTWLCERSEAEWLPEVPLWNEMGK